MALRLAEVDGVDVVASEGDDSAVSVEALVDDLVEPAKVTALEKLGEGERALRIARAWLRPKLRDSAANDGFIEPMAATL